MRKIIPIIGFFVMLLRMLGTSPAVAQRPDGQLRLEIVDAKTGQPAVARLHLKNSRGRPVAQWRGDRLNTGGTFFYINGEKTLPLSVGQYTFEVEAGPEYRTISGHFEIQRFADDSKRIEMQRIADLAAEGWWAGDLDAEGLPNEELAMSMRAESLHVVPLMAWMGDGKNFVDVLAGYSPARPPKEVVILNDRWAYGLLAAKDESLGGGLLLFSRNQSPAQLRRTSPAAPTSLTMLKQFSDAGAKVVAKTPYAWDMPVWIASEKLDAFTLIHWHSARKRTIDDEKDGRPRDRGLFPGKSGNGRWAEAVYHHALNCGFRLPPAAGSPRDIGPDAGPYGTNRVYVYCGDEFSYERWWDGLEAGRVFVTNGPLLRPMVNGQPPGHVFRVGEGQTLSLEVGLNLATSTPVEYLEIVKNGEVEISERLADWVNKKGRLPPLTFDDSGWFLVRAVTTDKEKYQLASTGPYYVEKAGRPRISKRSVRFFLDWIAAASERISKLPDLDDATRSALLAEQAAARQHFDELLSRANAE